MGCKYLLGPTPFDLEFSEMYPKFRKRVEIQPYNPLFGGKKGIIAPKTPCFANKIPMNRGCSLVRPQVPPYEISLN